MVSPGTKRLFVEQLKEAGDRLVHPPSDVNELLSVLDVFEFCLLWISHPPSKSIEKALEPMKKALIAEDLMRHSDIDVKVAVAACISEITRISAPEIPYDDEQMKKVFRLIVDAFEGLSDISSRSYSKRVSILEYMEKVPSCAVLLNLKCDAMILEMFQHFLKSITDYHPNHVFSAMETIMTRVLKESDHVSVELLSLLLDTVVKKDKYAMPRKLAKKVIRNCATKLIPDIIQYQKVFAAKCNGTNANASVEHPVNESKSLEKAGADRIPQKANKVSLKANGSGSLVLNSSQSVVTNDDSQTGNGDSLTRPSSPQKKPPCTDHNTDEAKTTDTAEKIEPDNLESKKVFIPETEPGQAIKKTRDVQNSPERSFDSSDNRELVAALEWDETVHGFALIEPCERREKTKAAYKVDKKLYAVESWENSKKEALEAEMKKIEERPGREKAEYVEKMKNEVALIHKDAEEKKAMIKAKCGEEILELICMLFAFVGGLLIGYWILENVGKN